MMFPSVTQVISPYCDFSKIHPDVLQLATARGSVVHELCARFANGAFIIPDEECRPYVESFQKWFALMVKEVLFVEKRVADQKWGFHGQIDLLCKLTDDRMALVDLKSPVTLQKSWRVQLAGYRHLCIEDGLRVDCVGSLRLSPDGSMAKMQWYENSAGDFNIFIQALQVYRFFNS